MQQYRVNYGLLVGLLVGTAVATGATYLLWRFQISRNAGALQVAAKRALDAGDIKKAALEYSNYLTIRPDDAEARVKCANAWIDVTEQKDIDPEDLSRAVNFSEETLRLLPDEKDLRRRLVDLYGRYGGTQQALDHLSLMVARFPDDVELQVLQMEYLAQARKLDGPDGAITKCMKLVGYDEKTEAFDVEKALAPNNASVYGRLAALLYSVRDQPDLAKQVMDQLIKVNPDSAEAHLQRGRFLVSIDEADRGERDIRKAYQLAPEDANVLLAMAERAQANERMEQAHRFLEQGNTKYPENPFFYQGLAGLELNEQKYEEALAVIDKGLTAVPSQESHVLLLHKAELQLMANDAKGARDTVEQMRTAGFLTPQFIEWMQARILLVENKWIEAIRALRRVKAKMGDFGPYADKIDFQLGLAYEQSGQLDLALQQYDVVLQRSPGDEPSQAGKLRIHAKRGLPTPQTAERQNLDRLFKEILDQPEAERNWTEIDAELEKLAEEMAYEGATLDLFWARVKLMRQDYAGALQHLVDGGKKDPKNLDVQLTAVGLYRIDPSRGPERARRLLDQVQERFGDRFEIRVERADVLIALHEKDPDEVDLKQELAKLGEAPADWTDDQKIQLWNNLVGRYLALRMRDEAVADLERVAALRADDLPTRLNLFSLALEANDDVAMRAAQDQIHRVVGSRNDSTWLFTEARRMLSLYRRGQLDQASLADIRRTIQKALDQRPDWFELHLVKAELEMAEGNDAAALAEFDTAQQLGRPNATALLQHVRLLVNNGQLARSKELIERLPVAVREGDLGQLYAEVLLNTGDMDEAVAVGKKFVEAAPDDAARRLAYGQLLARCASNDKLSEQRRNTLLGEAGDSLQRATELAPEAPENWLALFTFEALRKNPSGAVQALQQAQLALTEDQLIGVLAKANEALGVWFDAENMYLTAYRANPDNLPLAQELATFYLGPAYQQPDSLAKAAPLVNKILRAGTEGELPANSPHLMWARRAAARMFAAGGGYQNLRKAEDSLASNSQDGVLPAEDQLLMAEILARRPEPVSRIKAKNLLEKIKQTHPLSLQGELILGQLYFLLGDEYWSKCDRHMLQTVSRFPESADARAEYVRMILVRGSQRNYRTAADQLEKLKNIAPGDVRTIQYMVQLGAKTGKQQEARSYLLRLLPRVTDPADVEEKQLPLMEFVASLLVDLGDLENAEQLFRLVAARDPTKTHALANFLGTHRDVQQCMDLLSQAYRADFAEPTVRVAIGVARARRDEVGEKYDSQVQGWLDRALLENPDSIPLLMLQAEFDDVQKHYDEAAAVYQKLLARKDLVGTTRAIVLNNLAFLVALAGSEAEAGVDPLKLVQEAVQIMGPTPDILDSRAVVYISLKEYQKAIRDLEYSVTENPTPSKYFHKALAHLLAGENRSAIEAWEKAEALGPIREDLNRMEYARFDEVKEKIEQLRSQNSRLTDASR